MKINEHEAILTPRVLLVPYCAHHVPTYHEWMKDEEIQKATASEPLSLEEEYSMQQSWRLDNDKLTFIVCHAPSQSPSLATITPRQEDAPEKMIGDVNLFLVEDEDSHSENGSSEEAQKKGFIPIIGELEIMIAHTPSRGRGLARETLAAFMWYITSYLPAILEEYRAGSDEKSERYLRYLRVKIDQHNERSLSLFECVGFARISEEPNYFGEVEMRTRVVEGTLVDVEKKIGLEEVGRKMGYGSG